MQVSLCRTLVTVTMEEAHRAGAKIEQMGRDRLKDKLKAEVDKIVDTAIIHEKYEDATFRGYYINIGIEKKETTK